MKTNRDVLKKNYNWLEADIPKGTLVFEYHGITYGCIGTGIACTFTENEIPFFELPENCLDKEGQ